MKMFQRADQDRAAGDAPLKRNDIRFLPVVTSELEHLACAYQAGGAQYRFGLHVIGRAPLVACTPLGGQRCSSVGGFHDWA